MAQNKSYSKRSEKSVLGSESSNSTSEALLFGKKNFLFIGIGIILIALGFLLMSGGSMPSPDVWDESLIYSHRRITLAPILILLGLACQIYAIFVNKD